MKKNLNCNPSLLIAIAVRMGQHTLQLDKIQKIETLENDKKRTKNSYIIGAAGLTVGSFDLAAVAFGLMFSGIDFTMVR